MSSLPLLHRLHLPTGAPAPMPAIAMVHGWLGDENSMWAFYPALPPNALIISMRAPYTVGEGYGWTRERESAEGFEDGLALLQSFVSALPQEYPVDPARIIVMGFSQGAAMGYALTLRHPELIQGLAALAGFLPPASALGVPPPLAGKPIFIAHGFDDPTVPVEKAREARDFMLACGAAVTYHESKSGHKLSALGMRELKRWLQHTANIQADVP